VQKLAEFAPLLGIVSGLRPLRIVEIGTGRGGTLWAWCKVAPQDALLVSVDLRDGPFGGGGYDSSRLREYGQHGQTITLVDGDSHASETLATIEHAVAGPVDFLFIDGDHNYAGVSSDYVMYAPLVRDGGLIAFHDIAPGLAEHVGGVPRFWQELAVPQKLEIIDDIGSGGSAVKGYGLGLLRRTSA
jgi:predicted O-methyltransferase YrrM